jgi:hypothetical protein
MNPIWIFLTIPFQDGDNSLGIDKYSRLKYVNWTLRIKKM